MYLLGLLWLSAGLLPLSLESNISKRRQRKKYCPTRTHTMLGFWKEDLLLHTT